MTPYKNKSQSIPVFEVVTIVSKCKQKIILQVREYEKSGSQWHKDRSRGSSME